ncbi:MAG: hypothetical protein N3A65_01270 [candidate division WOR-3 bacterium]|nr:hypothetical protein [candidate division WOR-3 bacterium]
MIPLLISIAAIIFCIFVYHKKIGQLLLRIAAVILLYLLITNFSIQFKREINLSPPLILIDFSPSMKPHLHEILTMVDSLKYKFQKIFFSDSVYSDTTGVTPKFTNITQALNFGEKLSPSCIILISDGNHNNGPPPEGILKDFQTPIYCFGAGNRMIKDQSIAEVFHPDYAFFNDTIPIEVVIETKGFGGRAGKIFLKSENIKMEKEFRLSGHHARQSVEFKIVPKKIGTQKFKIILNPQTEESNYQNNEYDFTTMVFERKIKILYYTDHPSFNTRFILDVLRKNDDIELTEVIQIAPGRFYTKGRPVSDSKLELTPFDIIILDNINSKSFDDKFLNFLKAERGILVCGNIYGLNPMLNEVLPFAVSGAQHTQELPVKIYIPFSILTPLTEFAPVYRINHTVGVNQNTTLIARAGDFPLIGYRKTGMGYVFQINISELGVWHFTQININNQDILSHLINDVIKFLSPYSRHRRLSVKTARNQYYTGEQIKFYLKAYDKNLQPGSGGEFYLEFQDKRIPFFEIRPGHYEASIQANESGDYTLTARGILQHDTLSSNLLNLKIVGIESEPEELINEQLLEKISSRTGGGYYDVSQLKTFIPPEGRKRYEVITLSFDKPLSYFLIFILLLIDWIIRKKGGMV